MGCGSSIESTLPQDTSASGRALTGRTPYPPQAAAAPGSPKNTPMHLLQQAQRASDSTTERSKSSLRSGSLPQLEQSPGRLGGSLNPDTDSPANPSGESYPLPSHALSLSPTRQQPQQQGPRGDEPSTSTASQFLLSPRRSRSGSLALQLHLPATGTTQRNSVGQDAITTIIPTMRASPSTHFTSTGGQEESSELGSTSLGLETMSHHSFGIPAAEPTSPLWWQRETFMSSTNRLVSIPLQLERERRRLATTNDGGTLVVNSTIQDQPQSLPPRAITQRQGAYSPPPALDDAVVQEQHRRNLLLMFTSPTAATSDTFPTQDSQQEQQQRSTARMNSPPSQAQGLFSPTQVALSGILGSASVHNSPLRASANFAPGPSFLSTGRKKMVQSWLEDTTPLQYQWNDGQV